MVLVFQRVPSVLTRWAWVFTPARRPPARRGTRVCERAQPWHLPHLVCAGFRRGRRNPVVAPLQPRRARRDSWARGLSLPGAEGRAGRGLLPFALLSATR